MKKIYLINLPSYFMINDKIHVPLGIMYLQAYLESEGVDTTIIDLAGQEEHEWAIPDDGDIYGISAVTPQMPQVQSVAEKVKTKDNLVVLGGVHATALPEECLRTTDVDVIVRGEGEHTMLEIAQDKPLNDVLGVSFEGYVKGGRVMHTDDRPFERNLDVFPHPKLESLDMSNYSPRLTLTYGDITTEVEAAWVMSARGCPGRCTFCASPGMWKSKVRFHSVEYIKQWLEYTVDRGYKNHFFVDEHLPASKKRLKTICEIMKDIGGMWRCQTRGDILKDEVVKIMAEAGCKQVVLGVESGSQKILNIIKKGETVEDNGRAIQLCHKYGIGVKAAIMVGMPYEEQEDVDMTAAFIKKYEPEESAISMFTPYPGCAIFSDLKGNGYNLDKAKGYDQYLALTSTEDVPCLEAEKHDKIQRWKDQLLDACGDTLLIRKQGKRWNSWKK